MDKIAFISTKAKTKERAHLAPFSSFFNIFFCYVYEGRCLRFFCAFKMDRGDEREEARIR